MPDHTWRQPCHGDRVGRAPCPGVARPSRVADAARDTSRNDRRTVGRGTTADLVSLLTGAQSASRCCSATQRADSGHIATAHRRPTLRTSSHVPLEALTTLTTQSVLATDAIAQPRPRRMAATATRVVPDDSSVLPGPFDGTPV